MARATKTYASTPYFCAQFFLASVQFHQSVDRRHRAKLSWRELRKPTRVHRISVLNISLPVFNSTRALAVEHARIYGHVNYEKSRGPPLPYLYANFYHFQCLVQLGAKDRRPPYHIHAEKPSKTGTWARPNSVLNLDLPVVNLTPQQMGKDLRTIENRLAAQKCHVGVRGFST